MGENTRLDFEAAQTEAIGVQATAKSIEEISGSSEGEPTGESLELASQILDALKVEEPGMADMMIEQANQWKQIESAVDQSQLSKLLEISKTIPAREGGKDFLHALTTNIGDKDKIVTDLRTLFQDDADLAGILSSKPELGNLWYEHMYTTMKMASVVATSE